MLRRYIFKVQPAGLVLNAAQPLRQQKGFTLLELMIIVAILGVLAAITVPAYQNYIRVAQHRVVVSNLQMISRECQAFQVLNGRNPLNLMEVGLGNLRDPWGNAYVYLNIADADPPPKIGELL